MKNLFVDQTVDKIGETVELYGWVDSKRDHKKIVFIDLRDRTGTVQVVGGENFKEISTEDVIWVKGIVKKRPEKLINRKIKTGEIELETKEIKILSKAKPLPIPVNTEGYDIDEEIRLKYRYLDLRRPRMFRNLFLKSKTVTFIRNYLTKRDFLEIETPILTKTTPDSLPSAKRKVLCPSSITPTVQTAFDGRRHRKIFSDCPLFPRRRPTGRPRLRRIHPA